MAVVVAALYISGGCRVYGWITGLRGAASVAGAKALMNRSAGNARPMVDLAGMLGGESWTDF